MGQINVELKEYANAPEGSLLIRRDGRWTLTTYEELNRENEARLAEIDKVRNDFDALSRYSKKFVTYAKSHFLVIFNCFKAKVLSGELDVSGSEILKLDEAVINGDISVQDALSKHEFLKEWFNKVYLDGNETIGFPEV